MANRTQINIAVLIVFLTIILSVMYYSSSFEEEIGYCGTQDVLSYCGNKLNSNAREGRKLHKSFCASCHKLDKKLIGPALGGIQIDSISFFYHLTFKDTIGRKPHRPNFSQLTINNTNDILEYLK
jgi:hypothetical protein